MTENVETVMHKSDLLGNHIKSLEDNYNFKIPSDKPFVVRLDGHRFSKFTKNLKKPMDKNFVKCMVETAKDLTKEFLPVTAFVESDEITLVFPSVTTDVGERNHIYGGRVLKICSLTAGYASTRFNYHIESCEKNLKKNLVECSDDGSENTKLCPSDDDDDKMETGKAYFDARIFSCNSDEDAMNAVYWRFRDDAFRNGVNGLAQSVFSHYCLHKKSLTRVIVMLKEHGILLENQDSHLLYGTFVKRKIVKLEKIFFFKFFKNSTNSTYDRTIVHADHINLCKMENDTERIKFVLSKYW